jgi:phage shock protein C
MYEQHRELRRQNAIIGGVCGGLGAYFGINPWWFRVIFLILLMPGGLPGFAPYVILWIAIPRQQL